MSRVEDHVVVDVEIQKTIEETPGGWDATDKLGVACACLWEYRGSRMRVYGPRDVEYLQKRLLRADRITGFNIFNFDFPVIWRVQKDRWINGRAQGDPMMQDGELELVKKELEPKTNDLLRRIWKFHGLDPDKFVPSTHGGWSLDAVVSSTLGASKIGNGADAPKWYQQGLLHKVINYCADDVALERDLSDFVDQYGYVSGPKGKVDLREDAWKR